MDEPTSTEKSKPFFYYRLGNSLKRVHLGFLYTTTQMTALRSKVHAFFTTSTLAKLELARLIKEKNNN